MEDKTKVIRTFAFTGVVLHTVWKLLEVGIRLHPELILSLIGSPYKDADIMRSPLTIVMPLLSLAVFWLFYYLLHTQIAAPTSFSGVLLGVMLGGRFALAVVEPAVQSVLNTVLLWMYSAESLGAYSMAMNVASWFGLIDTLAFPLLIAAAGMNWYRYHCIQSGISPAA